VRVPRITVIIGEDHPVYRDGLAATVAADERMQLLAACADGPAVLAGIREHAPDVAVIDHELPELTAQEILVALAGESPATRVLVLSAHVDGERVLRAIEAGAAGYISKWSAGLDVCSAIVRIAAGEVVLEQRTQASMATGLRERVSPGPALTARELEILLLLAAGFSAPRIADELVIGTTTVKTHLANVYEKLGVTDRASAVAEAMRRGLIS
jgi:two-component system nitrate/nitrite response regulator NarL